MLLTALFFNIVLPFCLLQGFSPVCLSWHNKILFPEIKSTPALVPTPTPSPTPTPTAKPTAMPVKAASLVKVPVVTPKPAPVVVNTGPIDSFLEQINNYRRSQGLSSVRSDPNTCNFAQTRAQEIVNGFNHDGFNNRISSKSLPYSSYTKVTENLATTINPGDVVNMWINSPGHATNLRADTPYACVRNSGNYYAYESWKP